MTRRMRSEFSERQRRRQATKTLQSLLLRQLLLFLGGAAFVLDVASNPTLVAAFLTTSGSMMTRPTRDVLRDFDLPLPSAFALRQQQQHDGGGDNSNSDKEGHSEKEEDGIETFTAMTAAAATASGVVLGEDRIKNQPQLPPPKSQPSRQERWTKRLEQVLEASRGVVARSSGTIIGAASRIWKKSSFLGGGGGEKEATTTTASSTAAQSGSGGGAPKRIKPRRRKQQKSPSPPPPSDQDPTLKPSQGGPPLIGAAPTASLLVEPAVATAGAAAPLQATAANSGSLLLATTSAAVPATRSSPSSSFPLPLLSYPLSSPSPPSLAPTPPFATSSLSSSSSPLGGVVGIMGQFEALRSSQKLGSQTSQLLNELRNSVSAEGYSHGNSVKVVLDGTQRIKSVEFVDDNFLKLSEPYEVSAALVEALQRAHAKSIERMEERLRNFYSKGSGGPIGNLWS